MRIINARIEGFRNIENDSVAFGSGITSLVSVNSYGKSNLMNAIQFAVDFINEDPEMKRRMMSTVYGMPLNKKLDSKNYVADLTFQMLMDEIVELMLVAAQLLRRKHLQTFNRLRIHTAIGKNFFNYPGFFRGQFTPQVGQQLLCAEPRWRLI